MKILYLYQYFCTPNGGWSTRVYEFASRWIKQGHEVTVITAPYEKTDIKANAFVSRQVIEGINLIVINCGDSNRLPVYKRVLRSLCFAFFASIMALRIRKDVIIASSGPITVGIPGIISSLLCNKPLVFEVRDLWPDGGIEMGLIKGSLKIKISKWFEKACYKRSDLIVPCSIGMEAKIKKKALHSNTFVITNGSDNDLFDNPKIDLSQKNNLYKEKKILLYTGSIGFMNACEEIIEAIHLIRTRDDFVMIFIGEGQEKQKLIDMVKLYGLESKIKFLGLLSKKEVADWYSFAYMSFIVFKNFPVLSTSSPNKMFDSFSAGVPIVQNTKGWIKDLVETKCCGMNAEPSDPQSLAYCISKLLDNELLRNEMSQNAKRLALNEFNRDYLAKQYILQLEKLKPA